MYLAVSITYIKSPIKLIDGTDCFMNFIESPTEHLEYFFRFLKCMHAFSEFFV